MLTLCTSVRTFGYTVLLALALMVSPTRADTVLDFDSFSAMEPSGGGFVVATSNFSVAEADIPSITFDANFSLIDAGIEILVNGTALFNTGDDVSNFGPQVFQVTPVQPDNIDFSFNPNDNGLPRMTVASDSTGTVLTGAPFVNSTAVENYVPLFAIADFSSLLQPGDNTIEIVNLNNFEGASLAGDYAVTQVMTVAVPEPTVISVLMLGGLVCSVRRRRA
jgi:hypothetical protein